jgi:hypothetical protein
MMAEREGFGRACGIDSTQVIDSAIRAMTMIRPTDGFSVQNRVQGQYRFTPQYAALWSALRLFEFSAALRAVALPVPFGASPCESDSPDGTNDSHKDDHDDNGAFRRSQARALDQSDTGSRRGAIIARFRDNRAQRPNLGHPGAVESPFFSVPRSLVPLSSLASPTSHYYMVHHQLCSIRCY